jgi:hypothetical protein
MAYTSDEAGQDAVYIRPFPDANGGKWRVSDSGGGSSARWRADGRELFYVSNTRIMAVPVKLGDRSPELSAPQVLFDFGSTVRMDYAVTRDGARFLMPVRARGDDVPLTVVLNWPTLLERR